MPRPALPRFALSSLTLPSTGPRPGHPGPDAWARGPDLGTPDRRNFPMRDTASGILALESYFQCATPLRASSHRQHSHARHRKRHPRIRMQHQISLTTFIHATPPRAASHTNAVLIFHATFIYATPLVASSHTNAAQTIISLASMRDTSGLWQPRQTQPVVAIGRQFNNVRFSSTGCIYVQCQNSIRDVSFT